MLWWVLAGVHWDDYVVARDGRALPVLQRQAHSVLVDLPGEGRQWRALGDFQPLAGQVVRVGMGRALGHLQWPLFAAAAGLLACQLTLMGVRWWYLLAFHQAPVGLWATIRVMYIGHFFNFFLPGSTGGDVVRAVLIARATPRRTEAVATVLLDRFVGLAGMAALAAAMTLATWGSPQTQRAALTVAVVVAVLLVASAVMFSRRVARVVGLEALIARLPRSETFRLAAHTLRMLPHSPRAAAVTAAMTLGVHLLLPAAVACIGYSLGLPVPTYLYFLFIPVIYILAAVPISIGGLGLVEGMYVLFFAASPAVDSSGVLAMALLARLTPMLLSLPGLAFWLADRGPGRRI
jgi:hypothetical protein